MDIVYQKKEATVAQVLEDIPDPPSYTTVRTLLRLLENKGHSKHRQDGPRYVFYATVPREETQGEIIMDAFFEFFQASAGSAWHNDLLKYAHQEFPVYGPGHAMYFGTSQDLGFHPAHGAGCGSVWFGLVWFAPAPIIGRFTSDAVCPRTK